MNNDEEEEEKNDAKICNNNNENNPMIQLDSVRVSKLIDVLHFQTEQQKVYQCLLLNNNNFYGQQNRKYHRQETKRRKKNNDYNDSIPMDHIFPIRRQKNNTEKKNGSNI